MNEPIRMSIETIDILIICIAWTIIRLAMLYVEWRKYTKAAEAANVYNSAQVTSIVERVFSEKSEMFAKEVHRRFEDETRKRIAEMTKSVGPIS